MPCQLQTCAICLDDIQECKNCTTTECGHTFHSTCIFQNLCHRIECPMCRVELIAMPNEEDDDGDDGDDGEDGDEDDSDNDSEEEFDGVEEEAPRMSVINLTKRLVSMGYTMEDMVMAHLGGSFSQLVAPLERQNETFFEKFEQALDDIVDGKIAADFRDERTFAQVVAGVH